MTEAISRWMAFPKQIEAGLRLYVHGANIGQWHRGEMNSRELLVLIEGFPDDSWYKRSCEGYPYGVERDWTKAEYLAARQVAEIAASRGDFDPTGLVSPVEQAITDMKNRGEWPPAWWSEEARQKVMAEESSVRPSTQSEAEERRAVSTLVQDQLYGRS